MDQLSYRKINFEEFCAAATSPYRLEPLEKLEQISAHHLSILNRRETLTNWPRYTHTFCESIGFTGALDVTSIANGLNT